MKRLIRACLSLVLCLTLALSVPGAFALDEYHYPGEDLDSSDSWWSSLWGDSEDPWGETEVTDPPAEEEHPAEESPAGGALLSEGEKQQLFSRLQSLRMTSSSGAGAWEGELRIDDFGYFSGDYHDSDADISYEVSFTGTFGEVRRLSETTYSLQVIFAATKNTPGTRGTSSWGDPVEYLDSLFPANSTLYLTLPGTPDEMIPEMVRGLIGGTLDIWSNYAGFVTLTRADDGWGFFAEDPSAAGATALPYTPPTDVPAEEPTAAPTAEPTAAPTAEPTAAPTEEPTAAPTPEPELETPPPSFDPAAWTGYWMTDDEDRGEMVITDNGNGTLHMQLFFFRIEKFEADLVPQGDGTLSFDSGNGWYYGTVGSAEGGKLSLSVLGGYVTDDESEWRLFFLDRDFEFRRAGYDEIWYEEPSESSAPDGTEWLGRWVSFAGSHFSVMDIEGGGDDYFLTVSFDNRYTYSGALEEVSPNEMYFYGGEEFNGGLTLNRKLRIILLSDAGSMVDGINDFLDEWSAFAEYQYAGEIPGTPVPETPAPETPVPETPVPETPVPETPVPETPLPATPVPETPVPATPEPVLLPIAGHPEAMQVPVGRVDATSYIKGKDPAAYIPYRMIDGEETTSYQFSTKTTKPGNAYIYFDFDAQVSIDAIWMKNGFWKITDGKDQYPRNCRVKQMTIAVRYAGAPGYQPLTTVTLPDDTTRADWTVIPLGSLTGVTGVRVCVDSVYQGSKFKTDVCISEIMFVKNADQ